MYSDRAESEHRRRGEGRYERGYARRGSHSYDYEDRASSRYSRGHSSTSYVSRDSRSSLTQDQGPRDGSGTPNWDPRQQRYVRKHTGTPSDRQSSRSPRKSNSPRRRSKSPDARNQSFVPLERQWWPSAPADDIPNERHFTLMTYNCLAPSLAGANMYLYKSQQKAHGKQILNFNFRGPNLIKEIIAKNSDIVCLQEVDDRDYASLFEPEMTKYGYKGSYLRCTGTKTDGSAIFVKSDVFDIVQYEHIQYNPDKHNVGLIMMLQSPKLQRKICVATTHLLWSPKHGDIKLKQFLKLMRHVKDMIEEHERQSHATIPLLLCGDFNLNPGSFLYNFIIQGGADLTHAKSKTMSGQLVRPGRGKSKIGALLPLLQPDFPRSSSQTSSSEGEDNNGMRVVDEDFQPPAATYLPASTPDSWFGTSWSSDPMPGRNQAQLIGSTESRIVRHPFELLSVYAPYRDPLTNHPYFTTWHDNDKEIVDYIFFGHLKRQARTLPESIKIPHTKIDCLRYLKPPQEKDTCKMPNSNVPSDHIMLMAEFRLHREGEDSEDLQDVDMVISDGEE